MSSPFSSLQRFMIAFGLASVMTLSFFLTSMYMTHSPLREMSHVQVGIAIALPLLCGILAAIKDEPFLERLAHILGNTHL